MDATRKCPICFEDQSTQNNTCHCLDCGATFCIRCIVPWLPRPCPHCRSEAGLRYVTELPTYNIVKLNLKDADAQHNPFAPPRRRQRRSYAAYPTDIIPCCCIHTVGPTLSFDDTECTMGWARHDRKYLCTVCARMVPRERLVVAMSDAMNQTGGPPLCPAHGPRALLVQFLSPGRPTDWSGQENGAMGYFWYWTCFTHDNSADRPIILNCAHSEATGSVIEDVLPDLI